MKSPPLNKFFVFIEKQKLHRLILSIFIILCTHNSSKKVHMTLVPRPQAPHLVSGISYPQSDRMLALLHDISKYPYGTLSPRHITTRRKSESDAKDILGIETLGNGKIPSPASIVRRWFDLFFSDPNDFFCCEAPSKPIFRLCDYLTHSPFYCIYIAAVTMTGDHVNNDGYPQEEKLDIYKPKIEIQQPPHVSGKRRPYRKPVEKQQSIVGICSNPPKWIAFKNRRMIDMFIQNAIRKKNEHESGGDSYVNKVHHNNPSADTSKESQKVTAPIKSRKRKGILTDPSPLQPQETSITDTTNHRYEKKKTSWSLLSYVILDRYTHPPELITKLSKETQQSKGMCNRIHTLFSISQKHNIPLWISEKAISIMNVETEHELFFVLKTHADRPAKK
jgi:hypothetical protein